MYKFLVKLTTNGVVFILCLLHGSHYQRLSEEERKRSPLMLASMGGHAKCVTLLLEKGADVSVMSGRQLRRREGDVRREGRDSEQDHRSYNCLMEAIERGHK